MSQPTKEEIVLAAKRSLFKKSFYHFFLEFWQEVSPEVLVDNWHIKELCDELQIVGERIKARLPKEYDLIINVPPASSKSTIASILFPAWMWIIDPTIKVLSGSYAQSLSLDHAVKSRTVINSPRFKECFPEITLKSDNNNKGFYENDSKGVRAASSVGSGIIGKHFHAIIVDDPLVTNPSQIEIENADSWLFTALSSRKVDKSLTPTILIMQRLTEDDCTAMMLKKGFNVKHICLPAELTKDTTPKYVKYYKDGLFDPIRLSRPILDQSKIELGSKGYTGQYLQKPVPDDGGILKKEWFTKVKLSEDELKLIRWDMFIDSAYTADTNNDPSAIMVAGTLNNNLYIKKVEKVWFEFPKLLEKINAMALEHKCRKLYVEPKASGLSIIQTLRLRTSLSIIELPTPKDSKTVRVNAISPQVESKRVFLIEDSWNEDFLDECTGFPYLKHDDQVDCLVYAANQFLIKKTTLNWTTM